MSRPTKTVMQLGLGICFAIALIVPTFHQAAKRPSDPNMCASCHSMEPATQNLSASVHQGIACAQCHLPEAHFSQLALPIVDANCSSAGCHPKEEFYAKPLLVSKKNEFNHKVHYEAAVTGPAMTCVTCHARRDDGAHFSTITNNCFSCHHQDKKVAQKFSSCESCHQASVRFLAGEGRGLVERSPHAPGADGRPAASCAQCHRLDTARGVFLDVKPTCLDCHKETPAKGELYTVWQERLESKATSLAKAIAVLEADENRSPDADRRLKELQESHTLLGREGMHNFHAAMRMYEDILKEIAKKNENSGNN